VEFLYEDISSSSVSGAANEVPIRVIDGSVGRGVSEGAGSTIPEATAVLPSYCEEPAKVAVMFT